MPTAPAPAPAAAARPRGTVFTRSTGTVHAVRPGDPSRTVCGQRTVNMSTVPADPWTRMALVGPSCARCGYPSTVADTAGAGTDDAPADDAPAPAPCDTCGRVHGSRRGARCERMTTRVIASPPRTVADARAHVVNRPVHMPTPVTVIDPTDGIRRAPLRIPLPPSSRAAHRVRAVPVVSSPLPARIVSAVAHAVDMDTDTLRTSYRPPVPAPVR